MKHVEKTDEICYNTRVYYYTINNALKSGKDKPCKKFSVTSEKRYSNTV